MSPVLPFPLLKDYANLAYQQSCQCNGSGYVVRHGEGLTAEYEVEECVCTEVDGPSKIFTGIAISLALTLTTILVIYGWIL